MNSVFEWVTEAIHTVSGVVWGWPAAMPLLAELGYTVWAPNLRGYGGTSRPGRVRDYRIRHLVDDVAGLIDAAGADTFVAGSAIFGSGDYAATIAAMRENIGA